jgi:hypothetical protein
MHRRFTPSNILSGRLQIGVRKIYEWDSLEKTMSNWLVKYTKRDDERSTRKSWGYFVTPTSTAKIFPFLICVILFILLHPEYWIDSVTYLLNYIYFQMLLWPAIPRGTFGELLGYIRTWRKDKWTKRWWLEIWQTNSLIWPHISIIQRPR